MVAVKACNLLNSGADLIAHQVNCKGVMGGGVAKQIRERWPRVYEMYEEAVGDRGDALLGHIQICNVPDYVFGLNGYPLTMRTYNIVNMFSQIGYGRNKRHTDYDALQHCLERLMHYAAKYQMSVAVPFGLGCGLGGGGWNVVLPMILNIFEETMVDLTICKLTPQ